MHFRTAVFLLACSVTVGACGVDPVATEGQYGPTAPQVVTPAPEPVAPSPPDLERDTPPSGALPFPDQSSGPEPSPAPEPAPPPAPAPAPGPLPVVPDGPFELGLFFAGWSVLGNDRPSPNARAFTLQTTLPVGALIAYEVLPARRNEATGSWSVIADPQYSRRGVAEVRGRVGTFMTGMEHWNGVVPVFDLTGYPCELSEPFPQDGCPVIARAWFALEFEGPSGTVRQPKHVIDLIGELGEGTRIIRAVPNLFDLCSFEWFPGRCPALVGGAQPQVEIAQLMWD
jgi:hypothetical protein